MNLPFYKYHGNGNDFILINNLTGFCPKMSSDVIQKLCHRRFGIGADGLILMNKLAGFDFEMEYYNSDGRESTMCGNGGRCMVKFAVDLGVIKEKVVFKAVDGPHEGIVLQDGNVMLKMKDVGDFEKTDENFVINTGSPHFVKFVNDVDQVNVRQDGRNIRRSERFRREGINVNFVEASANSLKVRTYERGVEDETFSCGTGVVASALIGAVHLGKKEGKHEMQIVTPGGDFKVTFESSNGSFKNVWLIGGAEFVFRGEVDPDFFK